MHKETKCLYFRYAYDAGNRLVEVAYPGRNGITDTEYLRYDKAGNRTERIRGAVHEQYLYDECNRLLQITDGADTVKNYTYDNSGNMLSDGEMSYLYDGFGRLEQVTKADGSFQKNHYDAEGLRAEMEENGQLVKFLYNEDREAAAEEESDGNVIRYIRGLGLISSDSEKAKTYYHYVSDEQGSITHVINGEEKESGELPQEDVQSRVLNHYEYDAFGNTIRCEEQVHNRFRYTGEQYDPLTGQYYLRARYYNPVIARFTQEDTYYGDGLNLYTYCQNNPVLYHDPTGHGTKENSPYSRKEQQYIDAGADPDTARLAAQCYPDAKSKQDLYNKYKKQGYSAQDAKKLANREIIHGEEATKKYIKDNNVKKSGPDYTATSPRDNVNTDWRTQERLNAQNNNRKTISSVNDLTETQKDAIVRYTGDDYKNINNSLRGLETATAKNQTTIDIMKSALKNASLPQNMTLYRGTSTEALGNLKNLSPEQLVGKQFVEAGFMSTSANKQVANGTFSGNMQITIKAQKGAKALNISSISQYEGEAEILFNAGQKMVITDAKNVNGILHITVNVK